MKESTQSPNRKLIRPSLSEVKEQITQRKRHQNQGRQKRSIPPEQTNAENFYYVKQMQNRTPMVAVLRDGEELIGTIEWYDRRCLKLNRPNAPNVLVYKDSIKYLYKQSEKQTPSTEQAEPNGGATNGSAAN